MAEIKVKVGKKTTEKPTDNSKVGIGEKPGDTEVEAQGQYVDYVSCPYCWAVNRVVVDTNVYLYYRCWNCGNTFRV